MATFSAYQQTFGDLSEKACQTCKGLGRCNDADFGDISYSEWQCGGCKGTGFANGVVYKLTMETQNGSESNISTGG